MLIVDTSVALKWYVTEPGSDRAAELMTSALGAPDLILAEMANALWKKVRSEQISRDQAMAALEELPQAISFLVPSPLFAQQAFQLACELMHPVYDCVFLALSDQVEAPLVTADARLLGKCRGTRFEQRLRLL